MTNNELIAALEKATGGDRALDEAIARAIGFFDGTRSSYDLQLNLIPKYSASIDAALTLVPEGSGYELTGYTANEQAECILWDVDLARDTCTTVAPTPALAICIATLRARHAEGEEA